MTRRMERFNSGLAAVGSYPGPVLWTVPTGHKYELLELELVSGDVQPTGFYPSIEDASGTPQWVPTDTNAVPAGKYAVRLPWVPIVMYAGDKFRCYATPASTLHFFLQATYVDVDFAT